MLQHDDRRRGFVELHHRFDQKLLHAANSRSNDQDCRFLGRHPHSQPKQRQPWNQGNTAALAGTVQANFDIDQSHPSNYLINFTGSGLGIVGVNSGSYRPSISQYAGGTVNPNGTASGGNYSGSALAPAVSRTGSGCRRSGDYSL